MILDKKQQLQHFTLMTIVWWGMVLLVNPIGDFALNDDWVYGRVVKALLETGQYNMAVSNSAANLFSQAYWGSLFCLPFGFSFTALRFSTLVLGWIGIFATYKWINQLLGRSQLALVGAFLVALNPIYFGMSNTFMTDVPFYTFTILSFYFYSKGLNENMAGFQIAGIVFVLLAALIRQNALVFPIVFGVVFLTKYRITIKNIGLALIPAIAAFLMQKGFVFYLQTTGHISPNLDYKTRDLFALLSNGVSGKTLLHLLVNTYATFLYIGLFIAPVIFYFYVKEIIQNKRAAGEIFLYTAIGFIILVALFVIGKKTMPVGGNVLTSFGLGPVMLFDVITLKNKIFVSSPLLILFWRLASGVAVLAGSMLFCFLILFIKTIFKNVKNLRVIPWHLFVLFFLGAYYLPYSIYIYFDRYMLLLIPGFIVLIGLMFPLHLQSFFSDRNSKTGVVFFLVVFGSFTVLATHNYMAFNRTKWNACEELISKENISPKVIDAGYDINCWLLYDGNEIFNSPFMDRFINNPTEIYTEQFKHQIALKSWWYVYDDLYIISTSSIDSTNFSVYRYYPVSRWLSLGPGDVYVLKRKKKVIVG